MKKNDQNGNSLGFLFGSLAGGLFQWLFTERPSNEQHTYIECNQEEHCELSDEELSQLTDDFDFFG